LEHIIPVCNGKLAGQDECLPVVPVIYDLFKVMLYLAVQLDHPKVIDNQQVMCVQLPEEVCFPSFQMCKLQVLDEQTLLKETAEEINWDLKDYRYELLGYLNPYDHEELSAFMKVYLIRSDLVPNYNTNDFVEYFWLKPEELLAKIAAGEPAKGDLALLVRLFFC
jgi:8-oxo-dGTP pyrophosphatase MutT (NUDIX family)